MGLRRLPSLALLSLVMTVLLLQAVAASASEGVALRNPYPFTVVLVTPSGTVVLEPGGEAVVAPGRVCVASPQVYYQAEGIRYSLTGVLADGRLFQGLCADAAESLQPFYTMEYRVLVVSEPPGVVYREFWGPAGGVVEVEVPRRVEGDFTRHTLEALLLPGGVEVPDSRAEVALHSPTIVRALYKTEYRVFIDVVGREYWYGGGPLVVPVEEVTVVRGGVRLVPVKLLAGSASLEPQGGYFIVPEGFSGVLKPVFKKQYLLVVEGPGGERREWLDEGSTATLEFPTVIDVSPDERLVYRGAIIDGIMASSNRIELTMYSPHTVKALYDRQYRVRVTSIMGTTTEWVPEGALYTLSLPRVIPGGLFTRLEMTAVIVNGEAVPGMEALRLPVHGPMDITVVYAPVTIFWRVALAMVPVTLLSAAAAAYLYRWLQTG